MCVSYQRWIIAHQGDAHQDDAHQGNAHQIDAHQDDAHRDDAHRDNAHQDDAHQSDPWIQLLLAHHKPVSLTLYSIFHLFYLHQCCDTITGAVILLK